MNEIFSLNRFGKLLKNDFVRCLPKGYGTLISFLCIMPGLWAINAFIVGNTMPVSGRVLGIILSTMFATFFSIFKLYGHANHKKKGVDFTMLPASALEKLLSMILIGSLAIPVLFFLSAYILDGILATIPVNAYQGYIAPDTFFTGRFFENTGIFILFLSFALCGNMLFRKAKGAQTILSVLGLFMLIGYITSLSAYTLIKKMAYQDKDGQVYNMTERKPLSEDQITDKTIIIHQEPSTTDGREELIITRDHTTYKLSKNNLNSDMMQLLLRHEKTFILLYKIFIFAILPALMYFLTYRRIQKQQL